jgi:hypothetical protein
MFEELFQKLTGNNKLDFYWARLFCQLTCRLYDQRHVSSENP